MDRGQKRLVPKILGGVLRHPRLVNETSEAHNKCATVLYRNQVSRGAPSYRFLQPLTRMMTAGMIHPPFVTFP